MTCEVGVHVHPCSALVNGVCKNGFPFRRACVQIHVVSPNGDTRWPLARLLPPCLDEDFPLIPTASHP